MQAHFATLIDDLPGSRASRSRDRAAASGSLRGGRGAAERGSSIAADGGCLTLEHGLALAEAARCNLAAGDVRQRGTAMARGTGRLGCRTGRRPGSTATGARRARRARTSALTPFTAAAVPRRPTPPEIWAADGIFPARIAFQWIEADTAGLDAGTNAIRLTRRERWNLTTAKARCLQRSCCSPPSSSPRAAVAGAANATLPSVDADGCTTAPAAPVDTAVCRGKANFHDRTLAGLGGNGRACSDCHMDSENFQLTPAAAQARFAQMTMTGVDDPLFRAIDADDFRVNGAAAHDFTNLTQNGLIRVTIPLPANVKLLDCGATVPCPASARPTSETVADVWRAVPSILDVNITGPDGAGPASPRGPNPSGGYQLDGRIDTLQNQALARAAQPCRDHGRPAGELPGRPGCLPERRSSPRRASSCCPTR